MPSYNSGKTIGKSLESIKKQIYPKNLIEILVIDGGSDDNTIKLAKAYSAIILENPKRQQEYAKSIGINHAKGDIAIFLDSDEVIESNDFILKSVQVLTTNKIPIVLSTGYKRPSKSSTVNDYINFFSDPFAHFIYGTSSEVKTKIESWKKKYNNFEDKKGVVIFSLSKGKELPLVDMAAGTTIDLKNIRKNFSIEIKDQRFITRLFYLINKKDNRIGLLTKNPIIHDSADSYLTFLSKLRWRIRVNIHYKKIPGTGYSNREEFQSTAFRLRKYLFLAYAFTVIAPLLDSIYYFFKYKKSSLLLHLPLTLYTAFVIIYEYFLLIVGIKPNLSTYGKS